MILVLNAGSSSLKVEVLSQDLTSVLTGAVSRIGAEGTIRLGDMSKEATTANHAEALALMIDALAAAGMTIDTLTAAAHRVVHGGTILTQPARVTPQVIASIKSVITLAPLHNPNNLAAMVALQEMAPDLPQYVSFGTAFHATNPDVATRYAIPQTQHDAGIRRYGFHGLSYAHLVESFGADLPQRLLAFHLGNGASLCAILNGNSIATTMGYSPLSGLTMGTRSGDIDGAAVLRMSAPLARMRPTGCSIETPGFRRWQVKTICAPFWPAVMTLPALLLNTFAIGPPAMRAARLWPWAGLTRWRLQGASVKMPPRSVTGLWPNWLVLERSPCISSRPMKSVKLPVMQYS